MNKNKKQIKRSCKPLTLRERIDVEREYRYGVSITSIAKEIDRNKNTVFREVANKPRRGIGKYDADIAHRRALKRISKRGNVSILECNKELREYVIEKLKLKWSPEQISIRLSVDFPRDRSMRISYEAIYQYIYNQVYRGGNGEVKKDCEDLRIYLSRRP